MEAGKVMADSGKGTFIIHIQFQQNVTWQGTIQWVDKKKEQRFRSTLEMLKLIDDALAQQAGGESPIVEWDR